MSWSEGGQCFQVIERHGKHAYRVSVREAGRSRGKVRLHVAIDGAPIEDALMERVRQHVRVILGLDLDLSAFYALCEGHPSLHVIPRIGAGRLVRSTSMTENILKTICATNVNWSQAVKMINRLGQLGPPVRHFVHLTAWPSPREILRAGESYLKEVCRLGYRTGSVLAFCRDVCSGRMNPEELNDAVAAHEVDSDSLLAGLRLIPGVGPSSAHFLIALLGRYDRLVIDSATTAHVSRAHFNGRKPTPAQIEKIYQPFGSWKHLVCWFEYWLTWDTGRQLAEEAGSKRVPTASV